MKVILVTGCAGFIGSTLCEKLLDQGNYVLGMDNFDPFYDRKLKVKNLEKCLESARFEFFEGDISISESFNSIQSKVDLVIHIAAKAGVRPSIADPLSYLNVNVNGTFNVLQWMQLKGIKKMIFASSSSVYGNNVSVPFMESDIVDEPISPYAFSKKSAELLNHTYHHLYNFDILNLRFFTVYGERQRPDLAIHKFVRSMLNNEKITLYGDGSTARDYTYIGDIVGGIMKSMNYLNCNSNVFETINLGNSMPIKLIELVDELYAITGAERKIHFVEQQPGDVERTFADISKAKRLIGYEPATSLRDGLNAFVTWMRNQA